VFVLTQNYVDGMNFRKTMPDGRSFTQMVSLHDYLNPLKQLAYKVFNVDFYVRCLGWCKVK